VRAAGVRDVVVVIRFDIVLDVVINVRVRVHFRVSVGLTERPAAKCVEPQIRQRQREGHDEDEVVPVEDPRHGHRAPPCQ
jgi:hypothetical protein